MNAVFVAQSNDSGNFLWLFLPRYPIRFYSTRKIIQWYGRKTISLEPCTEYETNILQPLPWSFLISFTRGSLGLLHWRLSLSWSIELSFKYIGKEAEIGRVLYRITGSVKWGDWQLPSRSLACRIILLWLPTISLISPSQWWRGRLNLVLSVNMAWPPPIWRRYTSRSSPLRRCWFTL